MSSNKVGLGNVPKGLAWIAQRVNNPEQVHPHGVTNDEQNQAHPDVLHASTHNNSTHTNTQAGAAQLVHQETEQPKQASELAKSEVLKAAHAGLPTGWTRSTMIMKEDHLDQMKILASLKGVPLKELLAEALSRFLSSDDVKKIYMQELEKRYRV